MSTQLMSYYTRIILLLFQIRMDSRTDRRIHNLETELSKLRLIHNSGKERLRSLEREITHYQTVRCTFLKLFYHSFAKLLEHYI
jgi:hypothetical protein